MKLSPEHKEALAQGRREAAVVRRYLASVGKHDGRSVSPESLRGRIEDLEKILAGELNPMKRLRLHSDLESLRKRLSEVEVENFDELEAAFKEVAKGFSERRGIPYRAWRDEGVPARVLQEAGLRAKR